jgi:hypothetical protein
MLECRTVKYKFNLTAVALANKVARIVFVLNQRKRLGGPNTGQHQYERERMMRRRAMRTNHQGERRHPAY